MRGILWIKDSPDLLTATRLQFDESTVQKNLKRSTKIFNDIRTKFLANHMYGPTIFSDSVMENWHVWFDNEQKLWFFQSFSSMLPPLLFSRSYRSRVSTVDTTDCPQVEIEDCAFADLPDHTKTLTNLSGLYGTFTNFIRKTTFIWCGLH